MDKKIFTRKTAEELAALTPEERAEYFETLAQIQEKELSDSRELIEGLSKEVQSAGTQQEKKGRVVFTFEGAEYVIRGLKHLINPKVLLNDKAARAAAKNGAGRYFTTKEILADPQLISALIENGSEIIKPKSEEA